MIFRISAVAGLAGLLISSVSGPAHAAANLVTNGDFSSYTLNGNAGTASEQLYKSTVPGQAGVVVTGWTNQSGYDFLFTPGSADTTGAFTPEFNGTTYLYGPGAGGGGVQNGMTATSPNGNNFLALDGGFEPGALTQNITGLTIGANYNLSFYWGAAQQYNPSAFNQPTTESIKVSFGGQTFSTATINNPAEGFSPWRLQTFTFTATATSQLLSFLAAGSPSGQPPFSLLDGVSLTVPEPASWAVLLVTMAGLGLMSRRRRQGAPPAIDATMT